MITNDISDNSNINHDLSYSPQPSPSSQDTQSPIQVPQLLHDSSLTLSSLSLESRPDIDSLLPFELTSTPTRDFLPPSPSDHVSPPGSFSTPDNSTGSFSTPDNSTVNQCNITVVCQRSLVQQPQRNRCTPVRRTIRRDNRAVTACTFLTQHHGN